MVDGLAGELAGGDYVITPEASCRVVPFTTLVEGVRTALASAGALGTVSA